MVVSPITLNGTQNTPVLRSSGVSEVDLSETQKIEQIKTRFNNNGEYETKCKTLLGYLNKNILNKNYSFDNGDLPIETIFNDNQLPNNDEICNAGKKAYSYYLKEVLQKLKLLNQHIVKGQEALEALGTCTNAGQIKNYETILEIQDGLIKKYLDDFNKYTVVQTLSTLRISQKKKITGDEVDKKGDTEPVVETNYVTRGKIWGENGIGEEGFEAKLNALDSLETLRDLTTVKETGFQTITTTLCNIRNYKDLVKQGTSEQIASYLTMTNLNDEFGFNVVDKKIPQDDITEETSPIALFDELTLLEKLKYIHVYYHNRNGYPYEFYHYPEDLKSGVPCMSRAELEKFVHNTSDSAKTDEDLEGNDDELEALGIIPSDANKPKADLVEPGAMELFYVGYLEDSQGAINALAAFMEVKSVSMLAQIEQQSYRIKALKTYLKMLEFGQQELNNSFKGTNAISTKTYLAIKYAAANQTRTLVSIKNNDGQMEDYIVMQLDGGEYNNHNLSANNAYIYVKATPEGINAFLTQNYICVDSVFDTKPFYKKQFSNPKKINDITFYGKVSISNLIHGITTTSIENEHILFAEFNDKAKTIQHLPKELETVKVKMAELLKDFGNTTLNWRNATLNEDEIDDGIKREEIWPKLVEMWQNVCQTAIENIGSQIESVNKTIKSLRSKIDTFDSSANRFRDKFYSTTMTVLNKLS